MTVPLKFPLSSLTSAVKIDVLLFSCVPVSFRRNLNEVKALYISNVILSTFLSFMTLLLKFPLSSLTSAVLKSKCAVIHLCS